MTKRLKNVKVVILLIVATLILVFAGIIFRTGDNAPSVENQSTTVEDGVVHTSNDDESVTTKEGEVSPPPKDGETNSLSGGAAITNTLGSGGTPQSSSVAGNTLPSNTTKPSTTHHNSGNTNATTNNNQSTSTVPNTTTTQTDNSSSDNMFRVTSAEGKSGDIVTMAILLDGTVNICGFDLEVAYDPAILEFVSVDADFDLDVIASHNKANSMVKFNYATAKNRTRSAKIMELKFKIRSTEISKTFVRLKALEVIAVNANNDPMLAPYTLKDGMVTIK